jgi:hypothetical protein
MNRLLKILNKYIVLLIIWSIIVMVWFYIQPILSRTGITNINNFEFHSTITSLANYVDYLIRLIIIILLIIDFKKHKLNHIILTCITTLFYPLLGIVILSILLMEKWNEKACA